MQSDIRVWKVWSGVMEQIMAAELLGDRLLEQVPSKYLASLENAQHEHIKKAPKHTSTRIETDQHKAQVGLPATQRWPGADDYLGRQGPSAVHGKSRN